MNFNAARKFPLIGIEIPDDYIRLYPESYSVLVTAVCAYHQTILRLGNSAKFSARKYTANFHFSSHSFNCRASSYMVQ